MACNWFSRGKNLRSHALGGKFSCPGWEQQPGWKIIIRHLAVDGCPCLTCMVSAVLKAGGIWGCGTARSSFRTISFSLSLLLSPSLPHPSLPFFFFILSIITYPSVYPPALFVFPLTQHVMARIKKKEWLCLRPQITWSLIPFCRHKPFLAPCVSMKGCCAYVVVIRGPSFCTL